MFFPAQQEVLRLLLPAEEQLLAVTAPLQSHRQEGQEY